MQMDITSLDCECVTTLQCSDLFGCQYEYFNVLTCDELVYAMAITWLNCVCHCLNIE